MSAKMLMPNQCMPLHFLYGRHDCCLCNANAQITQLEARIAELETKGDADEARNANCK